MMTPDLLRWSEVLGAIGAAWLLTYALHSTVLIGGTWALQRLGVLRSLRLRDLAWRGALIGGLLTASLQMGMGLAPWGFTFEAGAKEARALPTAQPTPTRALTVLHLVPLGQLRTAVNAPAALDLSTEPGGPAETNVSPEPVVPQAEALSAVAVPSIKVSSLFFMAWVAVASALLLRLAVARARVLEGLGLRAPVLDASLRAQLETLCEEAGRVGPVQLTTAEGLRSPVALGWSEICLPRAALESLDAPQQRSVLAHELAHLQRQDPLWLLLGTTLEQLLFFQPLNRLARRNMQEVAEYLCDDWAAVRDGSGLSIARGLASVAQWLDGEEREVPLTGMAERPSLLVARVQRLLEASDFSMEPKRPWHVMAFGLVLLLMVVAVPGARAAPAAGWFEGAPTASSTGTLDVATGETRNANTNVSPSAVQREVSRTVRSEVPQLLLAQLAPAAPPAAPAEPVAPLAPLAFAGPRPHPHPTPHPSASFGYSFNTQWKQSLSQTRIQMAQVKAALKLAAHASHSGKASSADAATVDALVKALKDPDAGVRQAAAESLSRLQDSRAVDGLVAAAADSDVHVRLAVLEALVSFEDARAIPAFSKALKDPNAEVRVAAAEGLAAMSESQAVVEPLVSALSDADVHVRLAAVQGLAARKDKRALAALSSLVRDASPEVRSAAVTALGELQDPSSIPALTAALKDDNEQVRMQAVNALANLQTPKVIPALIEASKDKSADVRVQAAAALAQCNDASTASAVVVALKGLLEDSSGDVREQAINALSEIRDAGSVQALIAAMQSKDPVVRKAAAAALGQRD